MALFIETTRLLIRPPCLSDISDWYKLHANAEVMQYMGEARTKNVIQEWLEEDVLHYKKHGFSMGSVFLKSNNEFIGRSGLVYLDHDDTQPNIEIGYVLHRDYWGNGYATELVHALIVWGFKHFVVNKLVAVTRPENKKSQRILEKCGMRHTKMMSFNHADFLFYEINRP